MQGHKELVEMLLAYGAKITNSYLENAEKEDIKQLLRNPPNKIELAIKANARR